MSCDRSDASSASRSSASSSSRDALELGEELAARRREVERVGAAVGGVAAALGEAALLEVVDERDHRAAVDAERAAQRLLGLALVDREVAEHPEVAGVQVEGGQALGEAPVALRAELHQQKAGTAAEPAVRVGLHRCESTAPKELFMI